MKMLMRGGFLLSWATLGLAVCRGSPSPAAPSPAAAPTTFASALQSAKQAAQAGNIGVAESALTAFNLMPPGSGEWHLETSQKLMELATELAREPGNQAVVRQLGASMLQHLATAAASAKVVTDKAEAQAATALVYLNIVGDPNSALNAYKSALALNPNDLGIQQA
jgi:hypothetical protein